MSAPACDLCRRPNAGPEYAADHEGGVSHRRGDLCLRCTVLVHSLEDTGLLAVRRALRYIERHARAAVKAG